MWPQDVYTPRCPNVTTSALAEGAIEGVAADYRLPHKFATDFTFTRFGAAGAAAAAGRPRDVARLTGEKRHVGSAAHSASVVGAE